MPPPDAAPASTEIVTRPEPGLARGVWEAPPYAFYVAFAVVFTASVLYVLVQSGRIKLRRSSRQAPRP